MRIYENLVRLGNIDRKRMIAVAAKEEYSVIYVLLQRQNLLQVQQENL